MSGIGPPGPTTPQIAVPPRRWPLHVRTYLTRYFAELNMSTYWGSTADFCTELDRRLDDTT
jgi:hypothetical protein